MRRLLIALALMTALLATACGGEDDTATTDDPADAAESVLEDTADAADDAAAAAGEIDAGACTEAAEALTAVPQAIGTALTGQLDVEAVQAQTQAIADLDVPAEYEADFQVIADTYAEIASTLDGITIEPGTVPDAETQAALTELSTSLSDGAFATASTNLNAYFQAGCPSS